MRIWGADIPPGYLRWAATGAGVVVLGTLTATAVTATGLLGNPPEVEGTKLQATVTTSAPCNRPEATETVKFRLDNRLHQAKFDGCGHAKNEQVEITIPNTPLPKNLVVQAANATTGNQTPNEGLTKLLIVTSCIAGATYTHLIRKAPKPKPNPNPKSNPN